MSIIKSGLQCIIKKIKEILGDELIEIHHIVQAFCRRGSHK
ncbi:hypothetical protein [Clostridium sp. OS1-26]|nr:hypothetical protein [Clostridium sp. OS1-26]WML33654.1 hypothetical protein RCG18_20240 [Clostridium sp. OS1-26]